MFAEAPQGDFQVVAQHGVVRAKVMPDWIAMIYNGVAGWMGKGSTVMIQGVCGYDTGRGEVARLERGGGDLEISIDSKCNRGFYSG